MRIERLLTAISLLLITAGAAAEYPDKPVRIVSPFAVGGGGDIASRIVAQKISENTGKTFVVDNKVGAGGRIGYEYGARAPADGYTLIASDTTYTMMPGLYGGYPWGNDLDLVPVTILVTTPFVIVVSPDLKVGTLKELIALAKAQPGKLNFGSAGVGSINHVSTELLKREAGIDLVHVPYKGGAPATTDLLGGQVLMFFGGLPPSLPHIKSGRVRALAVSTKDPSSLLEGVPPVAATVPGFDIENWQGMFAPAGTPGAIVARIAQDIAQVAREPAFRDALVAQGAAPAPLGPAPFAAFVDAERRKYANLVKVSGAKVD